MSKSRRTITTTAEAAKAPLGTVVLTNELAWQSNVRIAYQKHINGWYVATGWEMADSDESIRGDVIFWGKEN